MDWSTLLSGFAVGFVAALLLVLLLRIASERSAPPADAIGYDDPGEP